MDNFDEVYNQLVEGYDDNLSPSGVSYSKMIPILKKLTKKYGFNQINDFIRFLHDNKHV